MENTIEEVKQKIDIVDFIGEYIPLKKAGRNFKANCPFHSEKSASFVISPDRQIWHCFGACQEGGDIFKFFMKIENITFFESLKELAQKANIPFNPTSISDKTWEAKEILFKINEVATEYYHYVLTSHSIGATAREYLKKREISEKIINSFQIGYSPSSWDSLFSYLTKKGFKAFDIERAGLIIKGPKTFYDRFRRRLMFPLKNHRNNILGFSGRVIQNDLENEAKYINTPETEIYHKRDLLFGISLSKESIKKEKKAIIVEGEFDMISCFERGVSNVVAVKGSAVTHEQLLLLKRYCNKIIFALDADRSGQETIKRTLPEAEKMDFETEVITFDYAKDPDEAIKKDPIAFKKLVDKPTPIYDFIIDTEQKKYSLDDPFAKKNLGAEIIKYIALIRNPIVKEHYIKKLAHLLDVTTESVEILIKEGIKRIEIGHKPVALKIKPEMNRFETLQKYILSLLFQNDNPHTFFEKMLPILLPSDFTIPSYRKLYEIFADYQKSRTSFVLSEFIKIIPNELIKTFDDILLSDMLSFEVNADDKELEKLFFELKKTSLKEQIKDCRKQEEQASKIQELTRLLSAVEKKLIIL